jgi:two-component system heavy metal sensor histidine kinase CusS
MKASTSSQPNARRASWSLALRQTLWHTLSSFILVVGATGYLYWALAAHLDRENDRFLSDQTLPVVNLLHDRPVDRQALRKQVELVQSAPQAPSIYFQVQNARRETIAITPSMGLVITQTDFPEPQPWERNVRGQAFRSGIDQWFRIMAVSVAPKKRSEADDPVYFVNVAMDRTHEEQLLADFRRNLVLALAVAFLVCAVAGYEIARRGVRPVRNIAVTAKRVGSATLNERIDVAPLPAELRALADTFNEMLERLETSFARLGQFAADIAHELRTPINNLRGEAEVVLRKSRTPAEYQEAIGSALEEYERLSKLIDGLLFLARAENPALQIERENVTVKPELELLREYYGASALDAGVELSVDCSEGLIGRLNRTMFQRAVGNLLSNALRYTPRGGRVTLTAAVHDDELRIQVADTGAGIAPVHLPRLFDRFYRVDEARTPGTASNAGLGLAIVKSIVELHGGTATITSTPGSGTTVALSFPQKPISATNNADNDSMTKL